LKETKFGKLFITKPKENMDVPYWEPTYEPKDILRILTIDKEVMKGDYIVETNWFYPSENLHGAGDGTETGQVKPHAHKHDEVLALFGCDPENPHELHAECEFWIEDEKHIVTKSCLLFIPKGTRHGPIGFTRIDRPVFQFGIRSQKETEE